MIQIEGALIEWMRSDATLVSLTSHATSDLRIVMHLPDMDVKLPSLILDGDTEQELLAGRTVYSARYRAEAYASTRVAASGIIKRLRDVIVNVSTTARRSRGPDFSNDNVQAHSLELNSIGALDWNPDMKYWSGELAFLVVWSFKS